LTRRPVVAFDYDGTLIDSYEPKRRSYWLAVSETLRLDEGAVTGIGPCGTYAGRYRTNGILIGVGLPTVSVRMPIMLSSLPS